MATTMEALTSVALGVQQSPNPRNLREVFPEVIEFTFVLDENSIAADVSAAGTFTVTGAALGDFVLIAPPVSPTAVLVQAYVSAANTVRVNVFNMENSDANTALNDSGTWFGVVLKRRSGWGGN